MSDRHPFAKRRPIWAHLAAALACVALLGTVGCQSNDEDDDGGRGDPTDSQQNKTNGG